jgi:hypothetical protein
MRSMLVMAGMLREEPGDDPLESKTPTALEQDRAAGTDLARRLELRANPRDRLLDAAVRPRHMRRRDAGRLRSRDDLFRQRPEPQHRIQ